MGPLFLFNQTRLPPTPFNASKTLHYNVQQISRVEAFQMGKTPAVWPFICIFLKSHGCYRDQWGGMNPLFGDCQCLTSAPSNYHLHLPAEPCGVFGEVWKGHGRPLYFHLRLDLQDTINRLRSSEQARCRLLCTEILRNVTQVSSCSLTWRAGPSAWGEGGNNNA